jgi:amino acid permease
MNLTYLLTPHHVLIISLLQFYTELKNNTVPRYLKVVTTSFAISIALFSIMGALGFLTFGSSSAGLILNSYSNKDGLMSISRFAVALSIVFSYPLAFQGCRDGVLDLIQVKEKARTPGFVNTLTAGMLSAITVAALLIPDVSFVLAFAGATLGSCLIYIYPALMFRGAIKKQKNPTKLQKFEVKVALSSALLGLGMGTLGAIKAVQSIL